MIPQHRIGRRSFLKLSSAALAAASFTRSSGLANPAESGDVVYSAGFVPPGADCKVAFVCDHHYWPGHLENWGDGSQITTSTERRMPDLVEVLNEEDPDLSIHAGDVISAGDSFFPPPEEYGRQLAFARRFYGGLCHPCMPLPGNHETLEPDHGEVLVQYRRQRCIPPRPRNPRQSHPCFLEEHAGPRGRGRSRHSRLFRLFRRPRFHVRYGLETGATLSCIARVDTTAPGPLMPNRGDLDLWGTRQWLLISG